MAGGRSRAVPRFLVGVGAAALSLAPLAFVTPASASPAKSRPSITLFSGDTKFSAAGQNWAFSITAFGHTALISVISTHEDDGFTFLSVPAGALRVNAKSGHATYRTGNYVLVHPDKKVFRHKYRIDTEDPSDQHIAVTLLFADGTRGDTKYTVAEDGRSMTESRVITGIPTETALRRVDDKTTR